MGIPKGSYDLAPKQTQRVKAFCLDHNRPAPSAGNTLGQVLSSSNSAVVNVGEETIPLQKAIGDGLVSVKGNNLDASSFPPIPSVKEIRKKLEDASSEDIDLKNMTSDEKDSLAKLLFEKMKIEREKEIEIILQSSTGDFRHLNFTNNTDKPITIDFKENAVIGETKESIDDVPYKKITPDSIGSFEQQNAMQEKLWLSSQQERLEELGFKVGNKEGLMDETTKKAIIQFEEDMGLKITGSWKGNSKLLNEITKTKKGLSNQVPPSVGIHSVKNTPPRFLIFHSDGKIEGVKDYENMVDKVSVSGKLENLIMNDFNEGEAIALVTTTRIRDIVNNTSSIRKFKGSKNKRITDTYPKITQRKDGKWEAKMPLDMAINQQRTLNIVSTTREKLIELLRAVAHFFNRNPDVLNMPIEQMVNKMKKELPNNKGIRIKDEELNKFYIVDTNGNTHIEYS